MNDQELGLLDADDLKTFGEEKAAQARDVFASQGDAILARVAQNILLAQAIRNLPAFSGSASGEARSQVGPHREIIEQGARAWLTRVLQGTQAIDPEAQGIACPSTS